MPIARYFLFVGGVLLALLVAIDALFPQQSAVVSQAAAPSMDKTVVRIRSDQKLPERVVYDTSLPTIVPPVVTAKAATPPAPAVTPVAADNPAQARMRETFAQLVPEAKKPEPQVQQRKRKVAKVRQAPMQFAQPPQMRVAQQSHFGFFGGGPSWNSTW